MKRNHISRSGSILVTLIKQCFVFVNGVLAHNEAGNIILADRVYGADPETEARNRAILDADATPKTGNRRIVAFRPHYILRPEGVTTGWEQLQWIARYIVRSYVAGIIDFVKPDLYFAACRPPYTPRYDGKGNPVKRARWSIEDATIEEWQSEVINAILFAVTHNRIRYAVGDAYSAIKRYRSTYDHTVNEMCAEEIEDYIDVYGIDPRYDVRNDDIDFDAEVRDLLNANKRCREATTWDDYDKDFVEAVFLLFRETEDSHPSARWDRYESLLKGYSCTEVGELLRCSTAAASKAKSRLTYWLLEEIEACPEKYEALFQYGLADPRVTPAAYKKPSWLEV